MTKIINDAIIEFASQLTNVDQLELAMFLTNAKETQLLSKVLDTIFLDYSELSAKDRNELLLKEKQIKQLTKELAERRYSFK